MYNVINAPWVLEIIAEKFDNALDLMPQDSIVFGGAVRDAIAGVKLEGDLDIVAAKPMYNVLYRAFKLSNKWLALKRTKSMNQYKQLSLNTVNDFVNNADARVQIIRAKTNMYVVAELVDIRCCGIVITNTGKILEIIDGAYQDCVDRVLNVTARINTTEDLECLKKRIKKLKSRGWHSKINLSVLGRDVKHTEKHKGRSKSSKEASKLTKQCIITPDSTYTFSRW